MQFGPSVEQEDLAVSERAWLERHDPIVRVREAVDSSPVRIDEAAYSRAAEAGILTLLLPETGGTQTDLAILGHAHGYAASSLPIADLALAAWLADYTTLPGVAAVSRGEMRLGLAHGLNAHIKGDALVVTGESRPVPMAHDLDRVVLFGRAHDVEYTAVVDVPASPGLSTLDLTRSWSRLAIDAETAEWSTVPAGTVDRVEKALALHRAVDAVGGAARLLDMTVTYAGQREQFGKLIGSFQAVKHHCADMALAVDAAWSVLWAAARGWDRAFDSGQLQAVIAAVAYAKAAASRVAGVALQVHGGIGFTWEHDLHLFLRRIKVDEALEGTVADHRAALASTF
jgi:alkylation response protein AidB-like acyl-CoA dehydrogenase